jgi:hypothetical protein
MPINPYEKSSVRTGNKPRTRQPFSRRHTFRIVVLKLRIGQMNDLISLIINDLKQGNKRPAKVLGEILALREALVSMGAQVRCG